MRKLLTGLVVVLLLAIVLIAGFLFIPSPAQKWAVERGASAALGRKVTFGEPFHVRAWPPLAITAADVKIANAEWGTAPDLVQIEDFELGVDALAYWSGHVVKIDHLVVQQPQIHLEVAADGRRNWEFGKRTSATPDAAAPSTSKPLPGFVLGDIKIADGLLAYDDKTSGLSRNVEQIALTIGQRAADQPVEIAGGATLDGKRATITGSVAHADAVAAGETSPATISVTLPGGSVSFDGNVNPAGPVVQGQAKIDLTAPRELLAWLGQQPALPEQTLRSAAVDTQLDLAADHVKLDQLQIQVDEIRGTGHIAASLGQPPAIDGELAFNRLDLNPYLPAAPAAAPATASEPAGPDRGWSETPIDLPLPLPVDLDLRLGAEGVSLREVQTGPLALRVEADRQRAAVTIDQLQTTGGQLTGSAEARPGDPPAYAVSVHGQGISVAKLLRTLGRTPRFDGAAALALDLTAKGNNQLQLVQSSNGKGSLVVRDGAILGINIAGMLRQIMTLGLSRVAGEQQRTDFAEAGGSFTVTDGILRNDDLALRAPVLRLEGAGTINLPQRTVDYRITPHLATTLEGQGATGEPTLEAGLPFVVQGPFDAPSIRFDLNGKLTSAVSSPADIGKLAAELATDPQALKTLGGQFGLLKKLPGGAAKELLQGAPELEGAARSLLKGLGR